MRMRKTLLAAVSAAGILAVGPLAGCGGSHHVSSAVSDSQLSSLTPEERAQIDAARNEVTQATQAESQARSDIEVEKRQVDVAAQEVKRAKATLAISKTNLKSANEGGVSDEMLQAKDRVDHDKAELDYEDAEYDHQKQELELGRTKLAEAQAWEYYARAKVELEKVKAVAAKTGDESPDMQTKVAKAQQQAANANLKYANARADTAKAQKRADKAKAQAETAKAAVPGGLSQVGTTQP